MKIIGEQRLHLVYTVDDNWKDKEKTKLIMRRKGYDIYNEYLTEIDDLDRVVTVFSKDI